MDVVLQFMIRQEVLKLYREILRTAREVHDESSRKEIVEWVRHDFKSNKHHTDEVCVLCRQIMYAVCLLIAVSPCSLFLICN
ncbi:hypothetical protein PR048_015397 [Dryococelus australis]|uniref:LYR motif-containing protein 2 n=1 Tax=Dryococelus australis TaxID=614101 RepID=A0ABQ9HHV3_9NEOP|nr:hypothetical protein PR048_015397 [Dryococelus australis]